jgi:hypothetical protein
MANPNDVDFVPCLYNEMNDCTHWTELQKNKIDGQTMAVYCMTCQLCRIADQMKLLNIQRSSKLKK